MTRSPKIVEGGGAGGGKRGTELKGGGKGRRYSKATKLGSVAAVEGHEENEEIDERCEAEKAALSESAIFLKLEPEVDDFRQVCHVRTCTRPCTRQTHSNTRAHARAYLRMRTRVCTAVVGATGCADVMRSGADDVGGEDGGVACHV